ncbi:MAG: DUF5926 family protein [Actinomycetes bacterium]
MARARSARQTSRPAARRAATGPPAGADLPVVGAREPCPCGSGRRYKACHGREAARRADQLVRRPFEGLASECDWVALREIVPAATTPLRLTGAYADRAVTLATVLPMAWPAMVRADRAVFVGLQVQGSSGDVSRDVAYALEQALDTEPGNPVAVAGLPGPGARLQDVVDPAAPLEVTVHEGFDFWLEGVENPGEQVAASLERANEAVVPTVRLVSVEAAYWCRMRDRNHLRWVLAGDEEPLLDALARLRVAGVDTVGEGSRYVGSFRAHGRLVPVWDLEAGTPADDVEDPVAAFGDRLAEALAEPRALTEEERRVRAGLLSRQLTIR